ncbi:hypothetical protein Tco_1450467, partial [Tanacetum coccineum]
GAQATGVAHEIKSIWNSTWRTGGRPGRSLGKTSKNSLTTDNSSMILGYLIHTNDDVETTELNRHEINFKRHDKLLKLAAGCFQWLAFCFCMSHPTKAETRGITRMDIITTHGVSIKNTKMKAKVKQRHIVS